MGMYCVYDFIVFLKLAGNINANVYMAAIDLVVYCFSEVVQETCAFSCHYISSQLSCKKTREMRNLYRMI
jgi:hypothetical protein